MALFTRPYDPAVRPLPPVDRIALREQMTRDDPDFARVRDVHHEAMQPLSAKSIRDGIALRREREFWTRHQPK